MQHARLIWIAALHTVWLCLLAPAPASAQSAAPAQTASQAETERTYQDLVRKGLRECDLEHWSEAKAYFKEAHAMQPSARTLRGLALTAYALRDYVEAIGLAEQALASDVRPLTEDMRAKMREIHEQAQHFVAHAHVALEPKSAAVTVDGRPVVLDAQGHLLLNPGAHELVGQAPEYESVARNINAQSGDDLQIELVLRSSIALAQAAQPLQPAATDAQQAPRVADQPSSGRNTLAPWIVVGVSGAAAVTGVVLFAMARSDIAHVEGANKGSDWADVKAANDRAPTLSGVGIALMAAGAVGVGVGLAWRFWPQNSEQAPTASARLSVMPGGARVSGTF